MAKAQKFKYTVSFAVTAAKDIKVKDLKSAVENELNYYLVQAFDESDGVKVGKATVVATK